MFYCNSYCVTHDQLKRDIYVKEHKYACKNWSTDPDFSRHGFSFSKHVRASRHVLRLCSVPYAWTKNGKGSEYSITERRVPELIPVLGSQPAGDVSHKPAVGCHYFPPGLKRAVTNFAAFWTEAQWVWTVCVRLLPDPTASRLRFKPRPFCAWVQHANQSATEPPHAWTAAAQSAVPKQHGTALPHQNSLYRTIALDNRRAVRTWKRCTVAARFLSGK